MSFSASLVIDCKALHSAGRVLVAGKERAHTPHCQAWGVELERP
jgi:hypothetical protein